MNKYSIFSHRHTFARRFIACLLIVFFLVSSKNPTAQAVNPVIPNQSLPLSENFDLPKDIGTITESFKGDEKKPIVFLIQDAHAVPEAQRSIEKISNYLKIQAGIEWMGVEGASSQLDPFFLRNFPDKKILRNVLDDWTEKGEFPGILSAMIFGEQPLKSHGLEEANLYEQGIELYVNALGKSELIEKEISKAFQALDEEKKKIYSPELLDYDRYAKSFEKKLQTLEEFLQFLSRFREPKAQSEVALILNQIKTTQNRPSDIRLIKNAYQDLLKINLDSSSRKELNAQWQRFQTSQSSIENFARFLTEFSSSKQITSESLKTIEALSEKAQKLADLRGAEFYQSVREYSASVQRTLLKTNEQSKLAKRTEELSRFQKWAKLELTWDEWKELSNQPMTQKWKTLFKGHLAFYENAEKRSHIFMQNLQKLFLKTEAKRIGLISGGFHEQEMTHLLKMQNISYSVIVPAIANFPQNMRYQELMKGNVTWKRYLKFKKGRASIYESFLRAVRDKLLEESNENRNQNIKMWRDNLIRNLASKNQIEKASNYIRFLDEEVRETDKSSLGIIQKIDQLIAVVKLLDKNNQFTQFHLLKFLQSQMTIPQLGGVAVLEPAATYKSRSELRTSDDDGWRGGNPYKAPNSPSKVVPPKETLFPRIPRPLFMRDRKVVWTQLVIQATLDRLKKKYKSSNNLIWTDLLNALGEEANDSEKYRSLVFFALQVEEMEEMLRRAPEKWRNIGQNVLDEAASFLREGEDDGEAKINLEHLRRALVLEGIRLNSSEHKSISDKGRIFSVSPNNALAVISLDGKKIYLYEEGKEGKLIYESPNTIDDIDFLKGGRIVFVTDEEMIRISRRGKIRKKGPLPDPAIGYKANNMSPERLGYKVVDGNFLKVIRKSHGYEGAVLHSPRGIFTFSLDGTLFANFAYLDDTRNTVWYSLTNSSEDWLLFSNEIEFKAKVSTAFFSPSGGQILIGLSNGEIRAIDIFPVEGRPRPSSGSNLYLSMGGNEKEPMRFFNKSSQGRYLAALKGKKLLVYDLSHSLKKPALKLNLKGEPQRVKFAPDSRSVYVSYQTGEIEQISLVWNYPRIPLPLILKKIWSRVMEIIIFVGLGALIYLALPFVEKTINQVLDYADAGLQLNFTNIRLLRVFIPIVASVVLTSVLKPKNEIGDQEEDIAWHESRSELRSLSYREGTEFLNRALDPMKLLPNLNSDEWRRLINNWLLTLSLKPIHHVSITAAGNFILDGNLRSKVDKDFLIIRRTTPGSQSSYIRSALDDTGLLNFENFEFKKGDALFLEEPLARFAWDGNAFMVHRSQSQNTLWLRGPDNQAYTSLLPWSVIVRVTNFQYWFELSPDSKQIVFIEQPIDEPSNRKTLYTRYRLGAINWTDRKVLWDDWQNLGLDYRNEHIAGAIFYKGQFYAPVLTRKIENAQPDRMIALPKIESNSLESSLLPLMAHDSRSELRRHQDAIVPVLKVSRKSKETHSQAAVIALLMEIFTGSNADLNNLARLMAQMEAPRLINLLENLKTEFAKQLRAQAQIKMDFLLKSLSALGKSEYAIGYKVSKNPHRVRDFCELILATGKIKQIFIDQSESAIDPALLAQLAKKGVIVTSIPENRQISSNQFMTSQLAAGLISDQAVKKQPLLLPVIVDDLDKVDNPEIVRLVLAMQVGVALLIAYESSAALLRPADLLLKYGLFSDTERNQIMSPEGDISAVRVRAQIERLSAQSLSRSA